MSELSIFGVGGLPEVRPGDDLAGLMVAGLEAGGRQLRDGDIVVVAQKVVSKAEGKLRRLGEVVVSESARRYAEILDAEPEMVQVVLDESVRVVRAERVLIVETRHGFICANAGVDHSNIEGGDVVTLLPDDCDASAAGLRARLHRLTGVDTPVIVADTFGRPWRTGIVNVALGVAGLPALIDYRGRKDDFGRELRATVVAIADELAAAAELVMGKLERTPAAVIRGYRWEGEPGTGRDLLRPAAEDLFR